MPALIGPIGTVVNMNQALNGNALGNPAYASQLDVANQTGGQAAIIANYNASLASANAATLATQILNNMFVTTAAGVSSANVTALTSALSLALSSYPTAKGQVISNLANILGGLEGDASWGAAAVAFNNQAAADYVYSTTLANTTAGVPSAVSTYTLFSTVDTITGTQGNDTITGTIVTGTAASTTLNVFDIINLGAGTGDILNVNYANTVATFTSANIPTLNGVEIINISGLGGNSTMAASIAPELTTLNVLNTITASNLVVSAASTALKTFGISGVTTDDSNLGVTYVTGVNTGTTDTATLTLTNANSATNAANEASDFTLAGASANQGVDIVNVISNTTGSVTGNRLGTLSSFDNAATTLTTLNVSGAGSLRVWNTVTFLSTAGTSTGTINASTATGAIDLLVGTANITYTGGTGNDVLRFAAASDLDSNDSINMGSGTDTVVLADLTISSSTTALNSAIVATGAEVVGFSGAATVDMSAVTPTSVASYQTANGTLTFTKLLAADTVIITQPVNAAADITISGQLGFTTANLQLAGSSTSSVSVDDITAQNLATLQIASNGGAVAVNTLNNLLLSDNAVVTITGPQGLTITNALENTAVVINGSAMTKALTVTAGTSASSLVGGSGDDVLTGGTGADTIVGGAGNDTINTGADGAVQASITGGLGADGITLAHVAADNATTALNATAAESYATAGQFDTVTFSNNANVNTNTLTLTTGVLSATLTGATSVTLGTTAVTAGSFLAVGSASAVLTTTSQNYSVYQDSNSNGIIEATDLRIDFNKTATDTLALSIVGNKLVVLQTGVA